MKVWKFGFTRDIAKRAMVLLSNNLTFVWIRQQILLDYVSTAVKFEDLRRLGQWRSLFSNGNFQLDISLRAFHDLLNTPRCTTRQSKWIFYRPGLAHTALIDNINWLYYDHFISLIVHYIHSCTNPGPLGRDALVHYMISIKIPSKQKM